jgi:hypothetical protein
MAWLAGETIPMGLVDVMLPLIVLSVAYFLLFSGWRYPSKAGQKK